MQRNYIFAPIAIWLASLFLIQILGSLAAPDSSTIPDECPEDSENCARETAIFQGSPEDVHAAALLWIRDYSQTNIMSLEDTSSHTVFRTKWMTFPDDFYLETGCTSQGTWLQVHSESRLGVSDLGANTERIDEFIGHMQDLEFESYDCT